MTHHTDAERAEFDAWWEEHGLGGYESQFEAWQAARRAPPAPLPQGLKLVPVVPTSEMLGAADREHAARGLVSIALISYQAMLAAAPQPPEAEENPLQEKLDEALQSLEFYKRSCDLLQSIQPRMRDPERTMVCDVLANGHLLQSGDGQPDKARYAPPEAAPVQMPEPFTTLVRKKSWSPNCYEASPLSNAKDYGRQWADERINVYTEQQVRELLAAHGIGKGSE